MNTRTTATTTETLQQCKNIPEGSSIGLMERPQDKQTPLNYNVFSAAQNFLGGSSNADEEDLDRLIAQTMKLEPVLESCCDDFGIIIGGDFWGNYGNILSGLVTNSSNATTLSCPQAVSVATNIGKEIIQSSNLKKRKAEQNLTLKEAKEDGNKDKKLKGCTEVRSSMSKEQNNTTKKSTTSYENKETSDTSKEKSKTSQVEKPDYIHVRARRGEATDSHSLAERVRREKISERMKYLQNLVPGCNNISGKAGMLDEIINYVQALQRQVEFLSMKLAAVYPQTDFNDDSYYTKEVFPASTSDFHHPVEALPDICLPQNYQSDVLQQAASSNGLEIGVAALKRTISAPVSIPGTIFESPCFNHLQSCSPLDAELQGIFGLELQQITGFSVGGHVRMEM